MGLVCPQVVTSASLTPSFCHVVTPSEGDNAAYQHQGEGITLHNNKKVKVQRCIRYTLLVMFYYALRPTYTKYFNSLVIPT
jgi:hypothetical protein